MPAELIEHGDEKASNRWRRNQAKACSRRCGRCWT